MTTQVGDCDSISALGDEIDAACPGQELEDEEESDDEKRSE